MTGRRVLVQVIGRAEGPIKGPQDLVDVNEAIKRIGGSMFDAVAKAFAEIGIEPTERGGGLGEWDCGAFIEAPAVSAVLIAIQDRFRSAFQSGLLRWHVGVVAPDTESFENPSPEEHPAELGRSNCMLCGAPTPSTQHICAECQKPVDMDPHACPNCGVHVDAMDEQARKIKAVSLMIARALQPLTADETTAIKAYADRPGHDHVAMLDAFLDHRRDAILKPELYRLRRSTQ